MTNSHDHSTAVKAQSGNREKNIKVAILFNITFTVIELIGGFLTNSLAIFADALHDLGDSISLITAWRLEKAARTMKPDTKRTFGYKRLSLLSAIINALVLIGGSLYILSEAVPRLFNPEPVSASGMIILAVVGIVFNGLGSLRLSKGRSANEKILTWHLLEDVIGWFVILLGGIIIKFWENPILDPIMTIGFTTFIIWGVLRNTKEIFNIFLQGVPSGISIEAVEKTILSVPGSVSVHDTHVWSLDGEHNVLTTHVVIGSESTTQDVINVKCVAKKKMEELGIEHSTIEIEFNNEI